MDAPWLFGTSEHEIPRSPDLEPSGEDLIPEQIPSIIDQRACIVYSSDASVEPSTTIESSSCGAAPPPAAAASSVVYPIYLTLDMTRGCGGKIWPAAEVLGAYIASMPSRFAPSEPVSAALAQHPWRHKTVVELGSGTGLVGFLVAKLGAGCETWITDQEPMLELMHTNAALNRDMQDPCHVAELNWGEALPADVPHRPDVVLMADCVYREEAFQPLVDTLCLLATPATEILFCYHKRRRADKRFFGLLKKHFAYDHVQDDDPARSAAYQRSGTFLMRFTKLP